MPGRGDQDLAKPQSVASCGQNYSTSLGLIKGQPCDEFHLSIHLPFWVLVRWGGFPFSTTKYSNRSQVPSLRPEAPGDRVPQDPGEVDLDSGIYRVKCLLLVPGTRFWLRFKGEPTTNYHHFRFPTIFDTYPKRSHKALHEGVCKMDPIWLAMSFRVWRPKYFCSYRDFYMPSPSQLLHWPRAFGTRQEGLCSVQRRTMLWALEGGKIHPCPPHSFLSALWLVQQTPLFRKRNLACLIATRGTGAGSFQ